MGLHENTDATVNTQSPSLGDDKFDYTSSDSSVAGRSLTQAPNNRTLDSFKMEISDGKWDFNSRNDSEAKVFQERFYKENYQIFHVADHLGNNIFHHLASLPEKKFKKLKLLMHLVVEASGKILDKKNKQGSTGLHLAVRHNNERMVKLVVSLCTKHSLIPILDDVLKMKDENGNNILHLAVEKFTPVAPPKKQDQPRDADKPAVDLLIEIASGEALRMTNDNGFTPLHLAVNGCKCTPSQLQIVKKLVERCEDALDVRAIATDKQIYIPSPFLHHRTTYQDWQQNNSRSDQNGGDFAHEGEQGMLSETKPGPFDEHRVKPGAEGLDVDKALDADRRDPSELKQKTMTETQKPWEDDNESQSLEPLPTSPFGTGSLEYLMPVPTKSPAPAQMMPLPPTFTEPNTWKPRRASTFERSDKKGRKTVAIVTPEEQRSKSPAAVTEGVQTINGHLTSAHHAASAEKVTDNSARDIENLLKHTYLRKRKRHQAREFLYSGHSGKKDPSLISTLGWLQIYEFPCHWV